MDDIINKLRSNQYKPGSQIMIAIDTHGAKRRAGASVEKTHRVALSNGEAQELTNLSGANLVDLDKLDTLAELASAKDVKLAVADLSCYSGNLLNIKNEKVCLISGTGPEHYSYTSAATDLAVSKNTPTTSFSGRFLESFKKGKNLEELFLAARDSSSNSFDSPDFPMINTEDGLAVNDMIYKLITPYLKYDSTRITNFTPQYAETSKEFEEQVCSINNNHELLIGLLKQYEKIEDISKFMGVNGYDFKSLRNALGEYRKYQIKFEESVRGKFEVDNEIKAMLEEKFPNDKDLWSKYRPSAYIITDSDQSLKYYEDLAADEIKKNRDAGAWRAMVAQLKRQKVIAAYVRANLNKSAQQKLKKAEDAYRETSVTLKLANNVSKEAKKVFTKLYKSVKRPKGNPCREFVL